MENKKGVLSMKTIGVIIIVAFLFLFFYNPGGESIFSSEKTTTTTTEIIHDTEVTEENINLCSLFQPYIVPGDTVNQCGLLGGDWFCRDDLVGCLDTTIPAIDCGGPAIRSAMYQCQSVGGEYTCDLNNAYCSQ